MRKDVIMATGRSDYPNQVNNVLGFPFIFRGALDVACDRDQRGDEAWLPCMRSPISPKKTCRTRCAKAYGVDQFSFGREYLIPKPFDPRVLMWEASAVAKAAMDTGVAQKPIDIEEYKRAAGRAA